MVPTNDHDLLIQIDTKLSLIADTVRALSARMEEKASTQDIHRVQTQLDQHKVDLESLQRFRYLLLGAVAALQIIGETLMHKLLPLP